MKRVRIGLAPDMQWLRKGVVPAALSDLDVLLFPELVDGGYAALKRGGGLHMLRDETVNLFRGLTAERHLTCIAGSMVLKDRTGLPMNSSLTFSQGRLIHRYDKIHLFRPAGDHRSFRPGHRIGTFRLPLASGSVRAGVILCYDLRFPELIRAMALVGMRLLLVPARWPLVRDGAWRTLLRARAVENQIFVVGCNARGKEGGFSYVYDPKGTEVLSTRGTRSRDIYVSVLDLNRLEEARRHHNNLAEAVLLRSMKIPHALRTLP
jgi:predicted amidohydrolase